MHRFLTARAVCSLALALWLALPSAAEKPEDLRPSNYTNDFAGVLSEAGRDRLNALGRELEEKTSAQIAIVTVRNLGGRTVEDFGEALFRQWGVGKSEDRRGVLILLAVDDRKYRIEVGYGLEPILPDGKVGGFGRDMVPYLRNQDYDGALSQTAGQIAQAIAEDRGVTLDSGIEPLADSGGDSGGDSGFDPFGNEPTWWGYGLFFAIVGAGVLRKIIKHRKKPLDLIIGLVQTAFVSTFLLVFYTVSGALIILFFLILAMLVDQKSGGGSGGGSSSGGWSSGSFGSSSSDSSFGGFGGGSSGGGGASGSW